MKASGLALALAGMAAIFGCASVPPTDDAAVLSMGERAFQRCYACHALENDAQGLDGPDLHRIVGRRIAAEPDYAYSEALLQYAAKNDEWTRERLSQFLADPQATVPGNAMGFFGIEDAAERDALVAYLAAQAQDIP